MSEVRYWRDTPGVEEYEDVTDEVTAALLRVREMDSAKPMPSGHDLAYANGQAQERKAILEDLARIASKAGDDAVGKTLAGLALKLDQRWSKGLHRPQ